MALGDVVPKSHFTDEIGPLDVLLNSIVKGAAPDSNSIEKEADGGTGVEVATDPKHR